MSSSRLRLIVYVSLFLAVLAIGTVGSMLIEKLSLTDAFYFTVVTVGTVGYGDIHPTTPAGKFLAIFLIVMGVGTFVGAVANITESLLERREGQARLEKLNMVIGVFFSEVGNRLLRLFTAADPALEGYREGCLVQGNWSDAEFARTSGCLRKAEGAVDLARVDLEALADFLRGQRDFLVRLLENPVLLEHQAFTDTLWAVFHLAEELSYREDKRNLPDTDRAHLAGDAKRAYRALVGQWLDYMMHLKRRYPYLFSLAVRTNPFDQHASPIVRA
jgi:voltage-gated potassium channel